MWLPAILLAGFEIRAQASFSQPYAAERVTGQLQKKSTLIMIDGAGGMTSGVYRKSAFWSVAPSAGYLVTDGLAAGLRLSYGQDLSERKIDTATAVPDYHYYSLAPEAFARYYITSYRIRPFVQLSAGYNFQWGTEEDSKKAEYSVKASNAIGAAAGGITFLLGKRLTFDLMYSHRLFAGSQLADANRRTKIRLGFSWGIF